MTNSISLGRVAGIEIGAHWSWALVVALITWSLSAGVFPETNPGLSDSSYLVMSLIAAVPFFASILLHELGHALQARRDGVEFDGITLWVFGGVARMRGEAPSPGAELRIAIAGPAVSLLLGVAFLLPALLLPLPATTDAVLFWLGQMNLYLLVFNLLPAFPLDGGRVLRAALWARSRDLSRATRTAATIGRGFGQLLIAGGVALTILLGAFSGLWLAFIGWFLLAAADAEREQVVSRDALDGLTVAQLMVRDPVSVDADASVQAFVDRVFLPTRHAAYPVLAGGRPLGIIGYRSALELPPEAWPATRVADIAAPASAVCVEPGARVADVLPRLAAAGEMRRLLVCGDDGRLVGLLSPTDVLRVLDVRSHLVARPSERPAEWRPRVASSAR